MKRKNTKSQDFKQQFCSARRTQLTSNENSSIGNENYSQISKLLIFPNLYLLQKSNMQFFLLEESNQSTFKHYLKEQTCIAKQFIFIFFQNFNLAKGPIKNVKDFICGVNEILDKELLKTSKTIYFFNMSLRSLKMQESKV